ncbi:MAG: Oar protein, partial [Thermomonas sp.]
MTNIHSRPHRRKALVLALALGFAAGAQAQTNTAGAVTGRAASGDTITLVNPATGFSRTITVDSSGSYRFSQLPTGQYRIARNGGSTRDVSVNVGNASTVDFVGGSDATTLDTVTVVGSGAINPIDVSSVESTTIMTAEQIAKIPVARDTTSVALLAPGTVRGDAAFGNLASFGGASVAENQFYVNGFNVTNTFNNLAFGQIPFEAIAEQQTKTGGYGAEFGRSLGGVVNQITKRGTN